MRKPGIYLIRNRASRALYVGHSSDTPQRIRQHRHRLKWRTHTNPILQAAWNKYGAEAFSFRHIATVADDATRCGIEAKVIAALRAKGRQLYNIGEGGEGQPHTEESRAKISVSRTGLKFSEQHRRRNSEAQRGRVLTPEWRSKLKANSYWRGKKRPPRSAEYRRRLSEAAKRRQPMKHTAQSKAKLSAAFRGRCFTPDTIERMRAARLRAIANGQRSRVHMITLNGETLSITDWGQRCGIKPGTISWRLSKGWPVERALA